MKGVQLSASTSNKLVRAQVQKSNSIRTRHLQVKAHHNPLSRSLDVDLCAVGRRPLNGVITVPRSRGNRALTVKARDPKQVDRNRPFRIRSTLPRKANILSPTKSEQTGFGIVRSKDHIPALVFITPIRDLLSKREAERIKWCNLLRDEFYHLKASNLSGLKEFMTVTKHKIVFSKFSTLLHKIPKISPLYVYKMGNKKPIAIINFEGILGFRDICIASGNSQGVSCIPRRIRLSDDCKFIKEVGKYFRVVIIFPSRSKYYLNLLNRYKEEAKDELHAAFHCKISSNSGIKSIDILPIFQVLKKGSPDQSVLFLTPFNQDPEYFNYCLAKRRKVLYYGECELKKCVEFDFNSFEPANIILPFASSEEFLQNIQVYLTPNLIYTSYSASGLAKNGVIGGRPPITGSKLWAYFSERSNSVDHFLVPPPLYKLIDHITELMFDSYLSAAKIMFTKQSGPSNNIQKLKNNRFLEIGEARLTKLRDQVDIESNESERYSSALEDALSLLTSNKRNLNITENGEREYIFKGKSLLLRDLKAYALLSSTSNKELESLINLSDKLYLII